MSKTLCALPGVRVVEMNIGESAALGLVTNFPKDDGRDFFASSRNAIPVTTKNKGDKNKKYIAWGANNNLPQEIIARSSESPYVAPSLKHLTDSTFSAGIKMLYVYLVYRNGKIECEEIDYQYADKWIEGRIRELERQEKNSQKQSAFLSPAEKTEPIDNSEEIDSLKKDLKVWQETWAFLKEFREESNLDLWLYEQASDANYFWNWYPALELNIGTPGKEWVPRIRRITHLEATYTRKGIMDGYGEIGYCVYSRAFAQSVADVGFRSDEDLFQVVIPALNPNKAAYQLRKNVEAQRNNQIRSRVTRYVIPMSIPTPGKFYYSWPSWWTIFKSRIFQYMLAMFSRRAMMMENSTMFKYIIHIDEEYIQYEYTRRGATSDNDKEQVFNDLMNEISDFIKNPKNNGKTLISLSKTIDAKKVKWVEIEVIESPMKGSDVKEDIAEIANVMLFAMGIHPQTVGAIPGKDKMASGTEARELNTLQQLYLFGLKKLILYPLEVVKTFNGLDEHLKFDIPVHVLTTLDKNKQGVEEMKN